MRQDMQKIKQIEILRQFLHFQSKGNMICCKREPLKYFCIKIYFICFLSDRSCINTFYAYPLCSKMSQNYNSFQAQLNTSLTVEFSILECSTSVLVIIIGHAYLDYQFLFLKIPQNEKIYNQFSGSSLEYLLLHIMHL